MVHERMELSSELKSEYVADMSIAAVIAHRRFCAVVAAMKTARTIGKDKTGKERVLKAYLP